MHYFQAVTVAVLALAQFSTALPSSHKQQKRAISSLLNGSPIGFASATTGGGDADPVYPTTIQELTEYLTSTEPQVVVISGTFDFTGSEGTMTAQACNAYSCTPDNGGQSLLDTVNGCGGDTFEVTLDKAGYQPLWIQSDKTLIGTGGATIKGKGFRLSGVENIIFQNFAITDLNPQYVWGGDAIALTGTKNIWIDHIHTKSLGRQHYSFGQGASSGVTISNSFIDGETEYSASCDGHTYWGLELVGEADQITFYKNYVYMTSGRTPALSGTTFFHAVNNVWSSNSGHMIEGTDNGMGVYEGNYIVDCPNVVGDPAPSVTLFTSEAADVSKCAATMGRDCVPNELFSSGDFNGLGSSSDILSQFSGLTIIDADPVSSIKSAVVSAAGNTLDGTASTGTKVIASPAAVVSSAAADVASSTPTAVVKPVASSGVSSTAAVAMYGQCGGSMYTGSTTCAEGSTCTTYNDFYSQCV